MLTGRFGAGAFQLTRLTIRAWLELAAFDLARTGGFTRVHARVRSQRLHKRGASDDRTEAIVWAVDEACVWYVKRVHCLQRSMVATSLLRRHGIRAELVIGYRPIPFESHAWVEVNGRVVNDRPQYQRAFAILDRL
jgi:transglutaminase superfamily protein